MDDPTKDNAEFSFEMEISEYSGSFQCDLREVENRAQHLMRDVFFGCDALRLLINKIHPSEEDTLQVYIIRNRISILCNELASTGETLQQAMEAMERNLQKLDQQYLNTSDADMEIKRAAERAEDEIMRLDELLGEINSAIQQVAEIGIITPMQSLMPSRDLSLKAIIRKQNRNICMNPLIGLEEKSGLNLQNNDDENVRSFDLRHPTSENETSTTMESMLSKIPLGDKNATEVDVDPHRDDLFLENTSPDCSVLNDSPYDNTIARCERPIISECGFDGSYSIPSSDFQSEMTQYDIAILGDDNDPQL